MLTEQVYVVTRWHGERLRPGNPCSPRSPRDRIAPFARLHPADTTGTMLLVSFVPVLADWNPVFNVVGSTVARSSDGPRGSRAWRRTVARPAGVVSFGSPPTAHTPGRRSDERHLDAAPGPLSHGWSSARRGASEQRRRPESRRGLEPAGGPSTSRAFVRTRPGRRTQAFVRTVALGLGQPEGQVAVGPDVFELGDGQRETDPVADREAKPRLS